jgi:hypothetical protein
MTQQRQKLTQALAMVGQGLDHVEALVPTLSDINDHDVNQRE